MLKRPKTIIILIALAIAALIVFWPSKLPKPVQEPNPNASGNSVTTPKQ